MSNEWIKFTDEMPPIDKTIEIKEEGVFSTRTVKARLFHEGCNFVFYLINTEDSFEKEKITHPMCWRNIPEKRPDFSKLRCGDIICIIWKNNATSHEEIGYFFGIQDGVIIYHSQKSQDGYTSRSDFIRNITKIIRINIEEQTFEEI